MSNLNSVAECSRYCAVRYTCTALFFLVWFEHTVRYFSAKLQDLNYRFARRGGGGLVQNPRFVIIGVADVDVVACCNGLL
jgi:hypothetical protein